MATQININPKTDFNPYVSQSHNYKPLSDESEIRKLIYIDNMKKMRLSQLDAEIERIYDNNLKLEKIRTQLKKWYKEIKN
jgi:hypothetical protein